MTLPEAVHLIGIGGTGLSAIARVLLERGCRVSGSDCQLNSQVESLQSAGAHIRIGHHAENILGAQLVLRSSAIHDDNVEVLAAHAAGIPVVKRAEFLGLLTAGQRVIAVAGSHGKTTTTAMIAWLLVALGLDPSYIIGGVSVNLGHNAHAGHGQYFVIEADEYDYMFLGLSPSLAVITNIEYDHPDCFPRPSDFYQAFVKFSARVLPEGKLLVCSDDPGGRKLMEEASVRSLTTLTYGVQQPGAQAETYQPDYQAVNVRSNERGGLSFRADCNLPVPFELQETIHLLLPGAFNVRNALATLAVAHQLDLPLLPAANTLGEFRGTGRRFEQRGEAGGVVIIDDYAHHPTQIRVTLEAARQRYPGRELVAVWQPHTFSRTHTLADDFARAFVQADRVVLTSVYASREVPTKGSFGSSEMFEVMQHPQKVFCPGLEEAFEYLLATLEEESVVLVFSAGDADQLSANLLVALQRKEKTHVAGKS